MSTREIAFEYVDWYIEKNHKQYSDSMFRDEFFDSLVLELQGLLNKRRLLADAEEVFNYILNIIYGRGK